MAISDPNLFTLALAAALAALGAMKIMGSRSLAGVFARLEYPSAYRPVTGVLQIAAAALLLTPHYRIEGASLAGAVLFVTVVGLLEHREYRWAALGIAFLSALWTDVVFGL